MGYALAVVATSDLADTNYLLYAFSCLVTRIPDNVATSVVLRGVAPTGDVWPLPPWGEVTSFNFAVTSNEHVSPL